MVLNGIQCDLLTDDLRRELANARPARPARLARDANPIETRAVLKDHLRRSMGADNYARACALLDELVGAGGEEQTSVGFRGAGDCSPRKRRFPDLKIPQRL
jgi:hypothetical protein